MSKRKQYNVQKKKPIQCPMSKRKQYNVQKKPIQCPKENNTMSKRKQYNVQKKKYKRTNNDLQNIT
jgi:hypothetical protein